MEGINTILEQDFMNLADECIRWCYTLYANRIYLVSHEGTITAYRQYLQKKNMLTREDFLEETGIYE